MAEGIERGADRRKGVSSHFTCPVNDRRRPKYERRGLAPVPAVPGMVRPGFAEAVPRDERRSVPAGGTE